MYYDRADFDTDEKGVTMFAPLEMLMMIFQSIINFLMMIFANLGGGPPA